MVARLAAVALGSRATRIGPERKSEGAAALTAAIAASAFAPSVSTRFEAGIPGGRLLKISVWSTPGRVQQGGPGRLTAIRNLLSRAFATTLAIRSAGSARGANTVVGARGPPCEGTSSVPALPIVKSAVSRYLGSRRT